LNNSNADKVTTNSHSQGIRFLNEITGLRSLALPADVDFISSPEFSLFGICRKTEIKKFR
jgi:hypothetical protein